jgi:fibronectin-binding autotransporter adhesin
MIFRMNLRGAVGGRSLRTGSRILASLALIICLLALPLGASAVAATLVWTGGGIDTNYQTAANWFALGPPAPGDVAVFPAATGVYGVTTSGGGAITVNELYYSGANAYSLTLSDNLTFSAGGKGITVAAGGAVPTININAGKTLAFVAGNGAGGATFNNAGTVNFSGIVGPVTAGSIAGAGIYDIFSCALTTGSDNTSTTVSGIIQGLSGSLEKVGTGTLTLNGPNTYDGTTTLAGGTLLVGNINAVGNNAVTTGLIIGAGTTLGSSAGNINLLVNSITVNGNFNLGSSLGGGETLTLAQPINLGAFTLTHNGTSSDTLSGLISGVGGSITQSAGTLTLSNTNTYTGTTTLTSGTLAANASSALGSGTLALNGGTLVNSSGNPVTLSNPITVGGAATIGGSGTLNFTGPTVNLNNTLTNTNHNFTEIHGVISGSGKIIQDGPSGLDLYGANTYTGGTTLSAGGLDLYSDTALGTGTLTINGPDTLLSINTGVVTLANKIVANNSFRIGSNHPVTLTGAIDLGGNTLYNENDVANTTINGVISGAGGKIVQGFGSSNSGILTLSGANTYSGGTTLCAGTLAAGSISVLNPDGTMASGPFGTGPLTIYGGTLAASDTGRSLANPANFYASFTLGTGVEATNQPLILRGAVTLYDSPTLTVNNTTVILGAIGQSGGSFGITKTGPGLLRLEAANTYTGGTTLYDGTLMIFNNQALGTGPLALNGGTLWSMSSNNSPISLPNPTTVGGAATIGSPGCSLILTGTMDLGANTLTVSRLEHDTVIKGVISGANGKITSNGALILSGANTYSGGTTLNVWGNLAAGSSSVLKPDGTIASGPFGTGPLTIAGLGALQASGSRTVSNDIVVNSSFRLGGGPTDNLTLTSNINLGSNSITNNGTGSNALSGTIDGAGGSIIQNSTGTLILSGANTYGGGTNVSAGTLMAGRSSVVAGGVLTTGPFGTGPVTIAPGATLNLSNTNQTFPGLGGAGRLTGTGVITVYGGDFSGVISGSGGKLLKDFPGTMTLSGANTYSGGTTLVSGTLAAGNNAAFGPGPLTIYNWGTLKASGTHTVKNAITLNGNLFLGGGSGDNLTLTSNINIKNSYSIINMPDPMGVSRNTLSGVISGAGGRISQNSGILTLSGANTYSGGTTLSSGSLVAGSSTVLKPDKSIASSPFGTGSLTIYGGWLAASGSRTVSNPVTVYGDFGLGGGPGDNLTLTSNIDLGGLYINCAGSGTTTLSGAISGSGGNIGIWGGTLVLSGANSYTGDTTIGKTNLGSGTLVAGNNAALGTSRLTIDGGTLAAGGAARTLANAVYVNGDFALGTGVAATNQKLTLTGPVTLYANSTITVKNTTEITGAIGQNQIFLGITKDGPGTLILSGANTYGGGTNVSAGILVAGRSSELVGAALTSGPFGTGPTTIAKGATINFSNTDQIFTDLEGAGSLTGTGVITIFSGNFSGVISGSGGKLVKDFAGTLTLSGANTYTGGTTLNSGTLAAGHDAAFGTGPLTISNWGTLQASGTHTVKNAIVMNGNLFLGGGGGDNLTLTSNINIGSYSITNSPDPMGGSRNTLSGVISGSGNILQASNGGLLILSGANTYSGGTTLSSGCLVAGSSSVLKTDKSIASSPFGTGSLAIYGGWLQASGSRTVSNPVVVNGGFSLGGGPSDNLTLTANLDLGSHYINCSGAGTTTLSGVISGSGGNIGIWGGTLVLSGANTYTGGVQIASGGTLVVGSSSFIQKDSAGAIIAYNGPLGTGCLTIWGGTLAAGGAARTLDNYVDINTDNPDNPGFALGTGVAATNQNLTLKGPVTLHCTPTITVNNTTEITGLISGSYGITKAGPGTLILSGANTYSGGTTVNAGILVAGSNSVVVGAVLTSGPFGTGPTTIAQGATLNLGNTNQIFTDLEGAGSLTGTGKSTVYSGNFSGVISGSGGSLDKDFAGTLTLSGANTYTGGTTLINGTLAAGNNKALGTGPLTINGGTLAASGGAITLANKVTMGGGAFMVGGANPLTLSGQVDLGNVSRTLTVNNTANTTLSGVISGAPGSGLSVSNTGPATLTLTGANTYSGGTTLHAPGILAAGNNAAFGPGPLTIYGGILQASGSRTVSNAVTVNGGFSLGGGPTDKLTLTGDIDTAFTIWNTGAGSNTLSGKISGSGGITGESGTLTLTGANTYTGGTYLGGGTLVAGNNAALGSGLLTFDGGTLAAGGAARTLDNQVRVLGDFALGTGVAATNQNLTLRGAVTLNCTPTITVNNTTEIQGAMEGSGNGFTKAGRGTLILSGANTYSGDTTVTAGTLIAASGRDNRLSTSGIATIAQGATLNLTNTNQTFADLEGAGSLTGTGTITPYGGDFKGVISGTGGRLVKDSGDTLTLSGANTYTGGTTLHSGILAVGNNAALGPGPLTIWGGTLQGSSGAITLANKVSIYGDLKVGGANPLTLSGTVNLLGPPPTLLTITNTANTTLSGVISGINYAGLLVDNTGGATLTLSGANTYDGGTYLNNGILAAGRSSVLKPDGTIASGPFGTGSLFLNGGTLQASGTQTVRNAIVVNGEFSLGGGPSDKLTLTVDIDTAFTIQNTGGSNTLSGKISAGGGITGESGTLTLTGANTYTDGTYFGGGTLVAGSSSVLKPDGTIASGPFGTGLLTFDGGTLAAGGAARTLDNPVRILGNFALGTGVAATNQNLTLTGAINLNNTPTITVNNTTEIQGPIAGGGTGFIKAGSGTLILSGDNSYINGFFTTVNAGTLIAKGGDNRLSTSGITTIAQGATLNLTTTTQTFANLMGAGTLSNIGALTVNGGNFSGVISGSGGSLVKNSADLLTLSGANTYTGGTTLIMGQLIAGNNKAFGTGPLTINGGTLAASAGAITLANKVTVDGNFTIGGANPLTLSGQIDLGAAGYRNLTVANTANTTLSGVISGAAGSGLMVYNGGGAALTLSGANTYSGVTYLYSGTLAAGNSTVLKPDKSIASGPFGTGSLDLLGGTLQASGSRTVGNAITVNSDFIITGASTDNLTLSGAVTLGGFPIVTVNSLGSTTISGAIGGGVFGLTKAGAGSLVLSGDNTYTGNTTLTNGTLVAGSSSVPGHGPFGNGGTLLIYGGTLAASSAAQTVANPVGLYADVALGSIAASQNLTLSGNVTLINAITHTLNVSNTTTISGPIGQAVGPDAITKTGPGTLILSGANTYSGGTTIKAGTLVASGGDNRLSTGGITSIAAGATLNLTNTSQTFAGLEGAGTLTGTGIIAVYGGDFSGVISGRGGRLVKDGADTLLLSGANTYTGGTTLIMGQLIAGNNKAFGTGPLTINGGDLAASGAARTLANPAAVYGDFALGTGVAATNQNLTLRGAVTLYNIPTITVNNTTAIQGGIGQSGGSFGITKAGPGTLVLSGANTYTGDTTVNAGTLTLGGGRKGRLLGNITVNSGGTFNLTTAFDIPAGGTFTMAGGILTAGGLLTNKATFTGYGTINANAGFSNYGTMTLIGGTSTVSGTFVNQNTGFLDIYNQSYFGDVTNWGYVKVNGGSGNFSYSSYTEHGTYKSDPATTTVGKLTIDTTGALQGGAGDKWIISGDFINQSTQNLTWNTAGADLVFTNVTAESIKHLLYLPGADLGRSLAGYTDNFAWGSLDLTGQSLTLLDGDDIAGGALYVGSILGVTFQGSLVTDITGNGLDIYYNPDLEANAYLAGLTYDLIGGGQLAPVAAELLALNREVQLGQTMQTHQTPLPASCWLFLSGLVGLGLLGRKKLSGRQKD